MIHHFVKLLRGHFFRAREIRREAGVQITGARAHHQSRRRRKAHACIHAFAVTHGGEARAVAEMREDDAALCGRRVAKTREFLHQIGIG